VGREEQRQGQRADSNQAKVYSDAIRTIFGKFPKEIILFFLHIMETVSIEM